MKVNPYFTKIVLIFHEELRYLIFDSSSLKN